LLIEKARRRKRKQKIRKLTQEDLLKEAKITEELNKQSLVLIHNHTLTFFFE
jgi:hypothetical protein